VSSQRQVKEGDGLGSQKKRCEDWVRAKGGKVEKVFEDEGVSGGLFERPAMKRLIEYLDANPHKKYTVVFDDLSRFARDMTVHLKLKFELTEIRGVKLECLNFNFDDTPEGEFIENVLASKSQLDRQQNRRQVIQKQKARLERGYWPFGYPLAFKTIKDREHGKLLAYNEPHASIHGEAIRGYAEGLLSTQSEVKEFVVGRYKRHGIDRSISNYAVEKMLKDPLFYGFIEYPKWGVERIKGHHKGLVEHELYEVVKARMEKRSRPRESKCYGVDFPLRGFVECEGCKKHMRGSWNRGRSEYYPNYWCSTKGCAYRYKTTKAWEMHPMFEDLLYEVKVGEGVLDLARAIFNESWGEQLKELEMRIEENQRKLTDVEMRIEKLMRKIETTSNRGLEMAYEERLVKLVEKKKLAGNKVKSKPVMDKKKFGTSFKRVRKTLENPISLWVSDDLEDKKTVLYMYFEEGLAFDYKKGFGTVKFSESISLLQDLESQKKRGVEMPGSDPGSANVTYHLLQA